MDLVTTQHSTVRPAQTTVDLPDPPVAVDPADIGLTTITELADLPAAVHPALVMPLAGAERELVPAPLILRAESARSWQPGTVRS